MTSIYSGKRVVILGLARQGLALARYLAEAGAQVVVSDRQTPEAPRLAAKLAGLQALKIEYVLGGHPLTLLDGADLLCLSGGVSADLPLAQEARRRGVALSNDSQIFLEVCPPGVTTVGLTGSAGKTTTTTLVGRMLAAQLAGAAPAHRCWVGGNIGNPLLAEVGQMQAGDYAVLELSSFQLEIMTRSPQVAAVLNITPNHLDRHGTMAAYAEAKSHIVRHQTPEGIAVLGLDDPGASGLAPLAPGRRVYFSGEQTVAEGACLRGDQLVFRWAGREQVVCAVADIQLRGRHNVLNALAACAISGAAGAGAAAMRAGLKDFTGVEHRLEFVRERAGVRWYNDSIATAPERTLAALKSFHEPLVLLAGGRDKKLPWEDLARFAVKRLKHLVVFGEAAPLIETALRAAGMPSQQFTRCAHLAEAVQAAAAQTQTGDVVLLSPGGTSYDEFADFAERGEKFKEWVRALP